MAFNPDIHHRRSIRLRDYDYSSAAAYFVTLCASQRECLFGEVVDGEMCSNEAGRMVTAIWAALPARFQNMHLDQYSMMPNHFHGIIMIDNNRHCPENQGRGESCIRPIDVVDSGDQSDHKMGDHKDRPYGTLENSLGRMLQAFKSLTTHAYVTGVNLHGWPPFPGRLWQRNFYEHIIRTANLVFARF
jgi:putative transposase